MKLADVIAEHAGPNFHFAFKSIPSEDGRTVICGLVNTISFSFDDEGAITGLEIGDEVDVTSLPVNGDDLETRIENVAKVAVATGQDMKAIAQFSGVVLYDEGKDLHDDSLIDHYGHVVMDHIQRLDVNGKWALNEMMRGLGGE